MATWYKVVRYNLDVTPVEVVKETEKSLIVQTSRGVARCAKSSDYGQYFPTRQEALLYHRNRLRSSIESAHARLKRDQADLNIVMSLIHQLGNEAAHGQLS